MLGTLVESRSRSPRRRIAMLASGVAHSILLSALVMTRADGTAQATEPAATPIVYVAPNQAPSPPVRRELGRTEPFDGARFPLPIIAPMPDRVVDDVLTHSGPIVPDFSSTGTQIGRDTLAPDDEGRPAEVLTERTVDQPVELLPGQRPPRYPFALERAGVGGDVTAQFVVDTAGRVERASIDVQHATHADFASAVRERLIALRFVPARARGRVVRQLVEQRFHFEVVRR